MSSLRFNALNGRRATEHFGIGVSQVQDTIAYVRDQAEHHRKRTFQEEYVAFLKAHGIEYDAPLTGGTRGVEVVCALKPLHADGKAEDDLEKR